jgi:hypothetical protein
LEADCSHGLILFVLQRRTMTILIKELIMKNKLPISLIL